MQIVLIYQSLYPLRELDTTTISIEQIIYFNFKFSTKSSLFFIVYGVANKSFFATFCVYFIKKRSLFCKHMKIDIMFFIVCYKSVSYTELNLSFVSTKMVNISSIVTGNFTTANAFSTPDL